MHIITISREFGSGGRELGKRLADLLGYDYYDREIIAAISQNKGMDENYVFRVVEERGWRNFPLSFRNSFHFADSAVKITMLLEQKRVIEQIAEAGRNCIIVGRSADAVLKSYRPFSLFVCADTESKILRCRQRASGEEKITDKEIRENMRNIDKRRAQTYELITGGTWGNRASYQLMVNTSQWEIKQLVPLIKDFSECWFRRFV